MPGLITTPAQIWLVVAPVDLRRGIDGLSALVQQTLDQSACAGSAFVFRNAAGNRIKVLLWDGNGVWLCQRRLHQGHFSWPQSRPAPECIIDGFSRSSTMGEGDTGFR